MGTSNLVKLLAGGQSVISLQLYPLHPSSTSLERPAGSFAEVLHCHLQEPSHPSTTSWVRSHHPVKSHFVRSLIKKTIVNFSLE